MFVTPTPLTDTMRQFIARFADGYQMKIQWDVENILAYSTSDPLQKMYTKLTKELPRFIEDSFEWRLTSLLISAVQLRLHELGYAEQISKVAKESNDIFDRMDEMHERARTRTGTYVTHDLISSPFFSMNNNVLVFVAMTAFIAGFATACACLSVFGISLPIQ